MRLRWKIGIVAGVAILGLAGSAMYSLTKDTTWLKTRISAAVEQQTGRRMTIGSLRLWFLPFPWIQARDIHFAGLPGERHDMASMRQLRIRLALRPLLSHRVILKDITLIDPDIYLLRLADGRANWQLGSKKSAPSTASTTQSSGKSSWDISVPNITINNAAIHWQDDVSHSKGDVQFQKIALHHLDRKEPDISVQGKYGPGDFLLSGHVGQVWPLQDKFPLDMTLSLSQQEAVLASAQVKGTIFSLQQKQPSYILGVAANVEQLAALNALSPALKLPKSDKISVSTNIAGRAGNPYLEDLHVRTGYIDLQPWMANSSVGKITIDGNTLQSPLNIHAEGHLDQQRVQADGNIGTLEMLAKNMLRENVPVNLALIEGSTAVQLHGIVGPRRASFDLDGSLASLPLKESNSKIDGLRVSAHAQTDRVEQLKLHHQAIDVLRALEVTGKAHIDSVNWQGAVWNNVQADFRDRLGRIDVDPIDAEGSGQHQQAKLSYDVADAIPRIGFAAHPVFVPLEAIRDSMHLTPHLSGAAEIVGEANSMGRNNPEIQRNLNGHMGVSIANGSVDKSFLMSFLKINLPLQEKLPVNCMGIHAKVQNGTSYLDDLGMQALIVRLHGSGQVGMESHDMNMTLATALLLGQYSSSSKVHVTGPWEAPHVGLLQANLKGGAPQQSTKAFCTSLLKASREGVAGPAPDLRGTTMQGELTNMIAKKLHLNAKDEKYMNQGLSIMNDIRSGKKVNIPGVGGGNGSSLPSIPALPKSGEAGKVQNTLSQFGL